MKFRDRIRKFFRERSAKDFPILRGALEVLRIIARAVKGG